MNTREVSTAIITLCTIAAAAGVVLYYRKGEKGEKKVAEEEPTYITIERRTWESCYVGFEIAWNYAPKIPFKMEYHNGTGYFNPLVDVCVETITALEDEKGRKILLIPHRGKTIVIFQRHVGRLVLSCNAYSEFSQGLYASTECEDTFVKLIARIESTISKE